MKSLAFATLAAVLVAGGSGCCCNHKWFGSNYAATTTAPVYCPPTVQPAPVVTTVQSPACQPCVPCCPQ